MSKNMVRIRRDRPEQANTSHPPLRSQKLKVLYRTHYLTCIFIVSLVSSLFRLSLHCFIFFSSLFHQSFHYLTCIFIVSLVSSLLHLPLRCFTCQRKVTLCLHCFTCIFIVSPASSLFHLNLFRFWNFIVSSAMFTPMR